MVPNFFITKIESSIHETGNRKRKAGNESGEYKDGAKLFITKIESSIHRKGNIKIRKRKVMHMHCSSRAEKKICQLTHF